MEFAGVFPNAFEATNAGALASPGRSETVR
jgi:hypothetical protein